LATGVINHARPFAFNLPGAVDAQRIVTIVLPATVGQQIGSQAAKQHLMRLWIGRMELEARSSRSMPRKSRQ